MRVFVKTLDGASAPVLCFEEETIATLKLRIHAQLGLSLWHENTRLYESGAAELRHRRGRGDPSARDGARRQGRAARGARSQGDGPGRGRAQIWVGDELRLLHKQGGGRAAAAEGVGTGAAGVGTGPADRTRPGATRASSTEGQIRHGGEPKGALLCGGGRQD